MFYENYCLSLTYIAQNLFDELVDRKPWRLPLLAVYAACKTPFLSRKRLAEASWPRVLEVCRQCRSILVLCELDGGVGCQGTALFVHTAYLFLLVFYRGLYIANHEAFFGGMVTVVSMVMVMILWEFLVSLLGSQRVHVQPLEVG